MSGTIRLITSNNSTGVSAYEDAMFFHQALGHDYTGETRGCVFAHVYAEFGYSWSNTNKTFTVKSGMGCLFGRIFAMTDGSIDLSFSNMTAAMYFSVYVSIDTTASPEKVELKMASSPIGYPSIGSTNLYVNEKGVATMELYRFFWNTSAIMKIVKTAHMREPGVAEKAMSIDASGTINGNVVSDFIENGTGYVKSSRSADYATAAGSLGPEGNSNDIDSTLKLTKQNGRLLIAGVTEHSEALVQKGGSFTVSLPAMTGEKIGTIIEVSYVVDRSSSAQRSAFGLVPTIGTCYAKDTGGSILLEDPGSDTRRMTIVLSETSASITMGTFQDTTCSSVHVKITRLAGGVA